MVPGEGDAGEELGELGTAVEECVDGEDDVACVDEVNDVGSEVGEG